MHNASEKIASYIHNTTSESNQTSRNMAPIQIRSNLSSKGISSIPANSAISP
ncbi:MAG: hypothetical protein R2685_09915 [Candidatus Nitrosocosmicus sp.]|nr:hypothetical protein [Candidatus Nitrosocosmicus sp.]